MSGLKMGCKTKMSKKKPKYYDSTSWYLTSDACNGQDYVK